ncbi:MAG TPA: AmmeMemoRadiSam system radical SAM enzyme [Clostridia bacterium]|nr:AmmeMemoRadiSam system radical SAM enzyme [Clostridia bacterium]
MPETHWVKKDNNLIQCLLCPHACLLEEGEKGRCRVRKNVAGKLVVQNYGLVTAMALDPIEKKPLYHFFPGKKILSLGTFGCNLRCAFCQNWQIAQQEKVNNYFLAPEAAVARAKELVPLGNIGLAYTYSEPLMWYEYLLATAQLAHEAGLKNVLVTNGYLNPQPLKQLLPFIDAVNLDLKAFEEGFYQELCQATLHPVLQSAKLLAENCHLEISTLLIPGKNDDQEQIKALTQWIAALDRQIPLHLLRYFPNYKLSLAGTPLKTMWEAQKIAAQYLDYVYLGNV